MRRKRLVQRVGKLRVNPDDLAEMAKRDAGKQDTITEWMEKLLGGPSGGAEEGKKEDRK